MCSVRSSRWRSSVIALVFLFPAIACADVVISEIAWMGSSNGGTATQNSNDEWIELYNSGSSAEDLFGWTLVWADRSVTLSGSIPAGGLYLLERTDDGSVPAITADLIYSGSLSNSGVALTLKDANGTARDTVSGGEDWISIGGNNETKETPQRTASGWVTAAPTPRALPASGSVVATGGSNTSADEGKEENVSAPASSGGGGVYTPQKEMIVAKAYGENRAIAGADVLFEGKAYGTKKEPLKNARYVWNFGDGEISDMQNVLHAYHYPGEYVVMLHVASGEYSATDRLHVTVTPARVVVSRIKEGPEGFIEITNAGGEEIKLSWWRIQAGESFFTIPKDTVLLSKTALPFANRITRLSPTVAGSVRLLYPNGSEAAVYRGEAQGQEDVREPAIAHASVPERTEISRVEAPQDSIESSSTAAAISSLDDEKSEEEANANGLVWWFAGAGAFALIAVGGWYAGRREREAYAPGITILNEEEPY